MKKYKVEIPKGYDVDYEQNDTDTYCKKRIIIYLKPIKKELPKTWEEFYKRKIDNWKGQIEVTGPKHNEFTALWKLVLLRDHYNDGWEPDWKNGSEKQTIRPHRNKISCRLAIQNSEVLSFKNESLRDEFLSNFAELIETAKILL